MNNIIKKNNTKPPQPDNYQPEKDRGFTIVAISFVIYLIGIMVSLVYGAKTYISFKDAAMLYLSFALVAWLIPKKWVYKLRIIHYERIIIAVTGFPMLALTLFFVLNYHINTGQEVRQYTITNFHFVDNGSGVYYRIKNPDRYLPADHRFKIDDIYGTHPTRAELTVGKGVFGFDVEKRLVFK